MWNLHRLAEKKAQREDEVEDWHEMLSRAEVKAREAGLSEGAFTEMLESLKSNYHLIDIFEVMAEHGRRNPRSPRTFRLLSEHVDESNYSLGDWLEAMAHICGWLVQNRKIATYEDILGYIHCCDESQSGTGVSLLLADEVNDCLNEHGFERATDWAAQTNPV